MEEKTVAVRYKLSKHLFEIIVLEKQFKEYKEGSGKLEDCVVDSDNIYKSNKKIASRYELNNVFGTDNVRECLKKILSDGKANVTVDETRKKINQKKKLIMGIVAKQYIDPKTKKSHPMTRIESAFENIKNLIIDPDKAPKKQIDDLHLIRKLIDTGLFLIENEMYNPEEDNQPPKKNGNGCKKENLNKLSDHDRKKKKREINNAKNHGNNKW